jgi:hypothetical protein
MQAWGPTKSAPDTVGTGPKSPLVAILAVVCGLLLVLVASGVAAFMLWFRGHEQVAAVNVVTPNVSVSVSVSAPVPVIDSVPDTATAASASTETSDGGSDLALPWASARPPPHHATPHDAGVHDAGLTEAEAADLHQKHYALAVKANCEGDLLNLRVFDGEAKRNAAVMGKMMCRGPDAVRCEREVCRESCTILSDSDCLRRLDENDRQYPTKY